MFFLVLFDVFPVLASEGASIPPFCDMAVGTFPLTVDLAASGCPEKNVVGNSNRQKKVFNFITFIYNDHFLIY